RCPQERSTLAPRTKLFEFKHTRGRTERKTPACAEMVLVSCALATTDYVRMAMTAKRY
ncbi:unnamed protein product, partial [Ectocarpus sp. 8 AP-2014]